MARSKPSFHSPDIVNGKWECDTSSPPPVHSTHKIRVVANDSLPGKLDISQSPESHSPSRVLHSMVNNPENMVVYHRISPRFNLQKFSKLKRCQNTGKLFQFANKLFFLPKQSAYSQLLLQTAALVCHNQWRFDGSLSYSWGSENVFRRDHKAFSGRHSFSQCKAP